jgi:hypothetical protein
VSYTSGQLPYIQVFDCQHVLPELASDACDVVQALKYILLEPFAARDGRPMYLGDAMQVLGSNAGMCWESTCARCHGLCFATYVHIQTRQGCWSQCCIHLPFCALCRSQPQPDWQDGVCVPLGRKLVHGSIQACSGQGI